MKKTLKVLTLALVLLFVGFSATAQEEETTPVASHIPKYVSDKGYWVVEGNIHNKKENIVHFYNNDDIRVYQETISGKHNLNKRKLLMHMKRMLDAAVVAWEQKRPVEENLFAATK